MTDTIDRAERTFHFERLLDASRNDVFDAWTKPDQLSHWWDPTGKKLTACTIDLKVNGLFRFVSDGHAPPFEGVYRVVERPSRLEFEAMGALGKIVLEDAAGKTRMRVSIRSPSAEHFDMFLKLGVNVGTSTTFDNLAAFVRRK
ncbi:MAG: hypothetical protein GQE15_07675 [Archangiaceae bacterium]|nr:hypothetical protein [Archangiaceae bacterium]